MILLKIFVVREERFTAFLSFLFVIDFLLKGSLILYICFIVCVGG